MKFKRVTAFLLSAILALTLFTSCGVPQEEGTSSDDSLLNEQLAAQAAFDELLDEDFMEYLTSSTLNLHYTLKNPENYGVPDMEPTWGDLEVYPSDETIAEARDQIARFEAIDRELLTVEQQQSYDIFAYDIALFDVSLDTYYVKDPFMGSNGVHANLPITMSEYKFYSEKDVEDYLALLETLDEYTAYLLEFERERSARGLFMTDESIDNVIAGCETFLEASDNMLISSFDRRISMLSDLSDEQKETYKTRNREIFDEVVISAYEDIIAVMEELKGTGVNDKGLAYFEGGKEYYAYELKRIGVGKTPEELFKLSDKRMSELYTEMAWIARRNPTIFDVLYTEGQLTDYMTPEDMIEYLKKASKDQYPSIPSDVSYTLSKIDDSIKDIVSPAFYFTPTLDNYTENSIYYNEDYLLIDPDYIFTTLAHEGYPGHLLQKVTVASSDLSDWRKLQSYGAFTEGWATYVEGNAYSFMDISEPLARFLEIDSEMTMFLRLNIDIGVNYLGWDMEDTTEYVSKLIFGESFTEEFIAIYYDFTLENPMSIVPYAAGLIEILELYDTFSRSLDDEFDEMAFHSEMLKYGEAPFELLGKWMSDALLPEDVDEVEDSAA